MSWMRMTVTIEGVEYTVDQKDKNGRMDITNVADPHDWIVIGVGRGTQTLAVSGKGWKGKNPK